MSSYSTIISLSGPRSCGRLGFEVEVSPKTNRQIVNLGLERVLSEAMVS